MGGVLRKFVALTLTVGGLAVLPATAVRADVSLPELTVGQTSVIEGDAGTAVVNVSVDLSAPSTLAVTVYATIGGGSASPGSDFFAPTKPVKVTFKPGIATKFVSVKVYGDQLAGESDETVPVTLSAPVNAVIGEHGAGGVTILDDDSDTAVGLQVSVGEVTIQEANGGTHYAYAPLTLSQPAPSTVKVLYTVSCGTADSGMDSYKNKGTVSFAAGTQSKQLKFAIAADMTAEDARTILEHISVLSGPATVNDANGGATVLDNDGGSPPPPGSIQRVSVASDGSEAIPTDAGLCAGGGYGSATPAISADGRHVAFASDAVNLSPHAAVPGLDIFVHDRVTGSTEQANLTSAGDPHADNAPFAPFNAYMPSISADGRYVTFYSMAPLAAGAYTATSGEGNVYRHDMVTGTTEVVDIGIGGAARDHDGAPPLGQTPISADGRYVAFSSDSTNLVTNDVDPPVGNGDPIDGMDVFVRDMDTGTTTLVSATPGNTPASAAVLRMSADGRYIAFRSQDTGFVPGDTNGCSDLFLRDMVTGTITRENVSTAGAQVPGAGGCPNLGLSALSNDGRYLAFTTNAWNLTGATTEPPAPHYQHLFLRDRVAGTTTMIGDLNNASTTTNPSITGDGRYIAYTLLDSTLWDSWQAYIYDTVTGDNQLVGQLPDGTVGDGDTSPAWNTTAISDDGNYVAFASDSTNLVPDDLNNAMDIFEQRLN